MLCLVMGSSDMKVHLILIMLGGKGRHHQVIHEEVSAVVMSTVKEKY